MGNGMVVTRQWDQSEMEGSESVFDRDCPFSKTKQCMSIWSMVALRRYDGGALWYFLLIDLMFDEARSIANGMDDVSVTR